MPAHTIAWIYDSASNETIVYVNPTDQTLNIGDSGLLEIHLQGIVSVEASDFVYAAATASAAVAGEPIDLELAATAENDEAIVTMTTADASSDWTVSDDTLLTDGNWTALTAGERDSFVFSSDGEARTYATNPPMTTRRLSLRQVNSQSKCSRLASRRRRHITSRWIRSWCSTLPSTSRVSPRQATTWWRRR